MRTLTLSTIIAIALLSPATANATYYLSKGEAEHYVEDHIKETLGYPIAAASCRPQGRSAPQKGYIYHRWSCGWAAGLSSTTINCKGLYIVAGSRATSSYYTKVVFKSGRCSLG